jgi:diadenosine tetraphosphate (Ap4A) HIT family hydrolase
MTDAGASGDGCAVCAMERVDEASIVFRDELWAAEVMPGAEVPGWIVLRVRRHAERITSLDDAESATFGRRARDLAAALTEATGAPATYILAFCENHAHFHALITARGAHVPEDRRRGDILKLLATHVDPVQATALVPAVRNAYHDLLSGASN